MPNNYQLAGRLQTTGWNPSFDVNAKNDYGMTPAEVAMQAGDLTEFKKKSPRTLSSSLKKWVALACSCRSASASRKATPKQ